MKDLEDLHNRAEEHEMFKDFFTGKYKDVPVGTIIAICCTLLYVLAPFDIIPDAIPVAGYLDDAGVLTACLGFVKSDVDKYKEWKSQQPKVEKTE